MSARRVLVIDDDSLFTDTLREVFQREGIEVTACGSCGAARERVGDGFPVVILDNHMPDGDGLDLVPELLAAYPRMKLLVCTAFPQFDNAVAALRLGLHDYLTKPVELRVLVAAVHRCFRTLELERRELLEQYERSAGRIESEVAGSGLAAVELRALITRTAQVRAPVLVTGETGTGKTLVARAIHLAGDPDKPFVHVNCAALPPALVEAELFGSERGSFTGATQTREGLFELADGGTLFLDEVGELPVATQAKLLTVLDDGLFRRVGASRPRRVEVRIVAATNADVEVAVERGTLRADLYYRLNVVRIEVPPLRQRREDIPVLTEHLLRCLTAGRGATLAPGEAEKLAAYAWPGNARELRNVLERALVLQSVGSLRPSDLLRTNRAPAPSPAPMHLPREPESIVSLAEIERRHLLSVLHRVDGNRAHAARALGVSVATLRRKLREYGAEIDHFDQVPGSK